MAKRITGRWIIIDNGELLTTRLKKEHDFTCLPWGWIEDFETIQQGLEREFIEELGIKPIIGSLVFINQWLLYKYQKDLLEFFFLIENPKDFRNIDISGTSHAFEIYEIDWIPIAKNENILLPNFIIPELQKGIDPKTVKIMVSE